MRELELPDLTTLTSDQKDDLIRLIVLDRLDLTLNESKTHIVDARQESFIFLGFEIRMSKSRRSGKRYTHICPAAKSLAKIKERITQMTSRERTPIPLEHIVGSMNATLRG